MLANMKRIRLERGYTLEQLSELTQITPHGLARLERGVRGRSLDTALNIARALDCSVEELVGEPAEEHEPVA